MRVHIVMKAMSLPPGFPRASLPHQFALVPLAGLPDLVRALRLADMMMELNLKLVFDFKDGNGAETPHHIHRALVEPFFKLQGRGQAVTLKGHVNANLSAELQRVLVPKVFWVRQKHRELLDLGVYKETVADILFSAGDIDRALDGYYALGEYLERVGREEDGVILDEIVHGDDSVLSLNMRRLQGVNMISFYRCNILKAIHQRDAAKKKEMYEATFWLVELMSGLGLTNEEIALWTMLCGISHFCLDRYPEAVTFLSAASRRAQSATCDKILEHVSDFVRAGKPTRQVPVLKRRLTELLEATCARQPLPLALSTSPSHIKTIHCERESLIGLGFTGDLQYDQLRNELEDCRFEPEEALDLFASTRNHIEKAERQSRRSDVIIGVHKSEGEWAMSVQVGESPTSHARRKLKLAGRIGGLVTGCGGILMIAGPDDHP